MKNFILVDTAFDVPTDRPTLPSCALFNCVHNKIHCCHWHWLTFVNRRFFFCHFFFCVTIFLLNVCSCRKIVKFSESHVKWIIVRTRAQVHKRINDFIDDLKENIFFVWIVCWTYIRRVRIVDGPGSMQFLAKLSNGFMQMQHLTIIFLFFLDFICRNVVALFRLWNAHTAVPSSNR